MFDVLIRNGSVVDGTGAPARGADVGIRDGRIVSLERSTERARRTIDADGLTLVPGSSTCTRTTTPRCSGIRRCLRHRSTV